MSTFNDVPYRIVLKKQLGTLRFKTPKGWRQVTHDASIVLTCTKTKGKFAKLSIGDGSDISVELFLNGKSELEKFDTLSLAAKTLQERLNSVS